MRVHLNALSLRPDGAGVSTYIRNLVDGFPPPWQAACTALVQDDAGDDLPAPVRRRHVSPRAGARRAVTGLWPVVGAGVVHGLDVDLPLVARGPTVTTVHDLSVFDVPWAFPARRVRGEQLLVRRALRSADVVLCVSHFTAERVRVLFGREGRVTPLAAGADMVPADERTVAQVRQRYGLPARFVLHVGTVEPRKDVGPLAEACREVGLPLVLAGAGGPVPGAQALGFVPRTDLPALFGAATVTAYVSRYEGFGLPPVEARACGGRVVATPVADLPDLLGDSVVWVRGGGLAAALREAAAGEERPAAPALTWQAAVSGTLEAYRELGGSPAS